MKSTFYIQGMHCASCEILTQKEIQKISGVELCSASHKTGKMEIVSKKALSFPILEKAIRSLGYTLLKEKPEKETSAHKNTADDYIEIAAIAGVFFLAFIFLRKLNIEQFFPNVQENVSVFIAFVLGIIASLSTCLALVGGIVLSFGSSYPIHTEAKHPLLSRAFPHIYFHIGRIGGFVLLGGILGMIGSTLKLSLSFTGVFTLIVALIMLYIGLHILGFLPNISKLGFHLPTSWSKKLIGTDGKNHPLMPMLLGVGTFFVPCGFTQSMQLAAIASGSFLSGSMIMGAFALGTLPVLFSLGFGSSYAQKSSSRFFQKVVGVFIAFFALYSLNSATAILGINTANVSDIPKNDSAVVMEDNVQIVKMDVDWGFSPDTFVIKKDVSVRWEINGINISGCVNSIIIPKLGIQKDLQMGLNVVEFTPTESGMLPFSCWMGMVRGQFLVQ